MGWTEFWFRRCDRKESQHEKEEAFRRSKNKRMEGRLRLGDGFRAG